VAAPTRRAAKARLRHLPLQRRAIARGTGSDSVTDGAVDQDNLKPMESPARHAGSLQAVVSGAEPPM
jgi:hypothetical protein